MSRRHFDSTENAELRAKIAEAKRRLPLPELLAKLGLGTHAKKTARCLWHDDQHPSFSVFQGKDGFWHYKCFVCDTQGGDEIGFLVKHCGISRREAISRYLDMAGFPGFRKSHEYPEFPRPHGSPECLGSHGYPVSLVYPVSKGQGLDKELEKELKDLAARNACTGRNTARKSRWQLLRDLRAVEKRIERKLSTAGLIQAFTEWHRVSTPCLDPQKTREDYFAAFLAEFGKVRVPTGEGETIKNALESVLKLPVSELPVIPDYADAPESWRRMVALHRELWQRSGGDTYFLTCRDAAKAVPGMNHQTAYNINLALDRLGVIKVVRVGDARPNGGRASEFRYLLPGR
jgi:hypothetical protein